MMRFPTVSLLLISGLLAACGGDRKPAGATEKTAEAAIPKAPESDLSKEQTIELMNMLSTYYGLKDALVATNGPKADEAASRLLSAAELFLHGTGSAPQATEMQPQLKKLMNGCDSIITAKADSVEQKRNRFAGVSEAMYKVLKLANLKNAKTYHQYCPMAMNDQGGYWLSSEEEIKNPYFGKKMLECGEVKDSL